MIEMAGFQKFFQYRQHTGESSNAPGILNQRQGREFRRRNLNVSGRSFELLEQFRRDTLTELPLSHELQSCAMLGSGPGNGYGRHDSKSLGTLMSGSVECCSIEQRNTIGTFQILHQCVQIHGDRQCPLFDVSRGKNEIKSLPGDRNEASFPGTQQPNCHCLFRRIG